ncbi:MAG: hypothetical protein FWG30_09600 [Eubacteriaceae bacterium]|nr:hypothetical protein [Eubacteriaceae bacterium]
MDGSSSDVECNKLAVGYLKDVAENGFKLGIYVADSKRVTGGLNDNDGGAK